jgi:hypothetical protein
MAMRKRKRKDGTSSRTSPLLAPTLVCFGRTNRSISLFRRHKLPSFDDDDPERVCLWLRGSLAIFALQVLCTSATYEYAGKCDDEPQRNDLLHSILDLCLGTSSHLIS